MNGVIKISDAEAIVFRSFQTLRDFVLKQAGPLDSDFVDFLKAFFSGSSTTKTIGPQNFIKSLLNSVINIAAFNALYGLLVVIYGIDPLGPLYGRVPVLRSGLLQNTLNELRASALSQSAPRLRVRSEMGTIRRRMPGGSPP